MMVAGGSVLGGLLGRSLFGTVTPVLAFVVGALAVAGPIVWFLAADVRGLRWGQKQTITFLALSGLTFIYFYPLWVGIPLDYNDFHRHLWLKSWI
jgi:dolichyl-phosphate-mannose--protein O-mannosyl transferase